MSVQESKKQKKDSHQNMNQIQYGESPYSQNLKNELKDDKGMKKMAIKITKDRNILLEKLNSSNRFQNEIEIDNLKEKIDDQNQNDQQNKPYKKPILIGSNQQSDNVSENQDAINDQLKHFKQSIINQQNDFYDLKLQDIKVAGFQKMRGVLTNQRSMVGDDKFQDKILKREDDEVVGWDEVIDQKSNEDSIKDQNDNQVLTEYKPQEQVKILIVENQNNKFEKIVKEYKVNDNNIFLSDFERLLLTYKNHRLKHCMAQFRDLNIMVNQAFESFVDPKNINIWNYQYDYAEKEKRMQQDILSDNLSAIIDRKIQEELREERRLEDERLQQEELDKVFEEIKKAEADLDQEFEKEQKLKINEGNAQGNQLYLKDYEKNEIDSLILQYKSSKKLQKEKEQEEKHDDDYFILEKMKKQMQQDAIRKYMSSRKKNEDKNYIEMKNILDAIDFQRVRGFQNVDIQNLQRYKYLRQIEKAKFKKQQNFNKESQQQLSEISEDELRQIEDYGEELENEIQNKTKKEIQIEKAKQEMRKSMVSDKNVCEKCGRSVQESKLSDLSEEVNQKVKSKEGAKKQNQNEPEQKEKQKQKKVFERKTANMILYPEIKVPKEFIIKFEKEKGLDAGTIQYQSQEIQDELRIRYLQKHVEKFEEFHETEMREFEYKQRSKMHLYAKECLQQIQNDLTDQYRFLFVQLDKNLDKESFLKKVVHQLKTYCSQQEICISELTNFIKWDQIEHDIFTKKLKDENLKPEDITKSQMETMFQKQFLKLKKYYLNIQELSHVESDNMDLSKPFRLYSNSIRLRLHERLNILERETVKIYRNKLQELEIQLSEQDQQDDNLQIFQEILSKEKIELEEKLQTVEKSLNESINKFSEYKRQSEEELKQTKFMYEKKIFEMTKDAEELYSIFKNEIMVKDTILGKQNEENQENIQEILRLTTKLKTPREHLLFLQKNGALEPFVSAVISGQDVTSKWMLMDVAKDEIDKIQKSKIVKKDLGKERGIKVDENGHLLSVQQNLRQNSIVSGKHPQNTFILTTSLTNDVQKNLTIQDKLQDINFTEVPYNYSKNHLFDSTLDGSQGLKNKLTGRGHNEITNETHSIGLLSNYQNNPGLLNPSLQIKKQIPIPINQAIEQLRMNQLKMNKNKFNNIQSISTNEANNMISKMNSKDFQHISIRDSNNKNELVNNFNQQFFEQNVIQNQNEDNFENKKDKITFRNQGGNVNSKSLQMKKRNSNTYKNNRKIGLSNLSEHVDHPLKNNSNMRLSLINYNQQLNINRIKASAFYIQKNSARIPQNLEQQILNTHNYNAYPGSLTQRINQHDTFQSSDQNEILFQNFSDSKLKKQIQKTQNGLKVVFSANNTDSSKDESKFQINGGFQSYPDLVIQSENIDEQQIYKSIMNSKQAKNSDQQPKSNNSSFKFDSVQDKIIVQKERAIKNFNKNFNTSYHNGQDNKLSQKLKIEQFQKSINSSNKEKNENGSQGKKQITSSNFDIQQYKQQICLSQRDYNKKEVNLSSKKKMKGKNLGVKDSDMVGSAIDYEDTKHGSSQFQINGSSMVNLKQAKSAVGSKRQFKYNGINQSDQSMLIGTKGYQFFNKRQTFHMSKNINLDPDRVFSPNLQLNGAQINLNSQALSGESLRQSAKTIDKINLNKFDSQTILKNESIINISKKNEQIQDLNKGKTINLQKFKSGSYNKSIINFKSINIQNYEKQLDGQKFQKFAQAKFDKKIEVANMKYFKKQNFNQDLQDQKLSPK